jgi:hypothetical protein
MASFTDQIPQFNPYVQQLPVEAMVTVGMEKQRRYDEGVQKIQTSIDNVAGLDVIRDIDKVYLQSTLNQLGSNLKMVAAGDFSNYQLVNSVSGMSNQIIKDPNVQNAVSSTAWYRKQSQDMEKAISEGKSSPDNIWDFNQKSGKWLNSQDINTQFRDRYTQYIDVEKKFIDVVKGLHSDLREEDIPYERNADGTLNYQKTAAAMQRISKETVSAAKIENALRATLTPAELEQLSISGRYQFRSYDTPDKLAVYSTTRFNAQIDNNNNRIKQLEGLANLSTSNPTVRKQALDSIKDLNEVNANLRTQLNEEVEYIKSDMDGAKATIYKNGTIAQFASAFAWEQNKSNLLTNPVLEAQHWERNFALDQSRFNLSVRSQNWTEFKGRFDMNMANKDYALKFQKQMFELYGVGADGNSPFTTYLGQSTKVKDPLTAMQNDIIDLNSSADVIVQAMAKDIKGSSIGQIEQAIRDYNSGDPKKIANASKIIPVEWRDQVNQIINSRAQAKILDVGVQNARNEVSNSPEFLDRKQSINESVKGLPSITIKDAAGNNVVFTPTEIAAYLGKVETKSAASPGGMGIATSRAIRPLTPKEKLLYNAAGKKDAGDLSQINEQLDIIGGIKDIFGFGTPKQTQASSLNRTLQKYNENIQNAANIYTKDLDQAVAAKIMQGTGTYVPKLETITFGSGEGNIARRTWEGITSNALAKFDSDYAGQIAGGDEKMDSGDRKTASGWLNSKNKDDIIYKKLTQGNKTYVVMINGNEEIFVPLSRDEVSQLPKTSSNVSPEYVQLVEAQTLLKGTTNPTGDFSDGWFNRSRMPNVTLDVKADLTSDKSNGEKQYINLMLNTPSGVLPLKLENYPMDRTSAAKFIGNLTNEKVKQLYLEDPSIPQEWKDVVKNLK